MIFIAGCSTPTEKVDNAEKDVDSAERKLEYANESLEKDVAVYKKNVADKLDAQEKILSEFNDRIAVQKSDAKKEYEQKIADLNKKNSDLKKKMDEFKASNHSNWEKFKKSYNTEMEDLGFAFEELKTKMGVEDEPKK